MTDQGLEAISGLQHLNHLRIDGSAVADRGMKYLRRFPNLHNLYLEGTEITDALGSRSTLALAGGGLQVGGTVGESSPKAEYPITTPISPQDLMATVFHVLGIDPSIQFTNTAGRPVSAIPNGQAIRELI